MRPILVCVLLLVVTNLIFSVSGQEKKAEKGTATVVNSTHANDQIEVKEDRFSGVTTVTLKPQVILDKPDHQLTMEIEAKLGEKGQLDFEKGDLKAEVQIRSLYKGDVDFGDQQLHLLIDGKPIDFGEIPGGHPKATDEMMRKQRGFRISTFFSVVFDRHVMEQLSNAARIEMRLGPIEPTLGQPTVAILREYANQVLAKHKIVRERKQ